MKRGDAILRVLVILAGLLPVTAVGATRDVKVEGKAPAEYVAEQYGRSWAVMIGINLYRERPAIPELRYAVADAKAMGEELKARGFTVISLLDEDATRDRILEVLGDELPQKLQPDDRLAIFYAGHGETKTIPGGQTMGYLLPVDAKRDRLHRTAINMGEIRQLAALLPAKHVLFVVDVCYGGIAGQQTRSLPDQTVNYLKQITKEKGRQLITAGGPGQQVVEGPQWGHSVFTHYLLEGLAKGLADLNHDGVIPTSELYAYLDGRVPAASENQQRPELWTLAPEKGEFVFFTSARSTTGGAVTSALEEERRKLEEERRLDAERERLEAEKLAAERAQVEAERRNLEAERKRMEAEKLQGERAKLEAERAKIEEERKRLAEERAKREQPKPIEEARARPYEAPQQAGREITGKDGAPMVLVPAGEFVYGDNNQRLSLSAFYMDKFEVTTRLYAAFMQATGRAMPTTNWYWSQVSLVSDGDRPVIGVTWHDAEAYCRNYGKRLPTEQEWEKAARGTDGRTYTWGSEEPTSRRANFDPSGKFKRDWQGYSTLATVESYEAGKSPYGIYNMAGNVREWTSSDIGGSKKVIRGGSWDDGPQDVRSAHQNGDTPAPRYVSCGFRCAQDPR